MFLFKSKSEMATAATALTALSALKPASVWMMSTARTRLARSVSDQERPCAPMEADLSTRLVVVLCSGDSSSGADCVRHGVEASGAAAAAAAN